MDQDSYEAGKKGYYSGNARDYDSWSAGNQERLRKEAEERRYQESMAQMRRAEEEKRRAEDEARRKRSSDAFSFGQSTWDQSTTRPNGGGGGGGRGGGETADGHELGALIFLVVAGLGITAWFSVEVAVIAAIAIVGLIIVVGAVVLGLMALFALLARLLRMAITFVWGVVKYVASLWIWCLGCAVATFVGVFALAALGVDVSSESTQPQPTWEVATGWAFVGLLLGCGVGVVAHTIRGLWRATLRLWRVLRHRFGTRTTNEARRAEPLASIPQSLMIAAEYDRLVRRKAEAERTSRSGGS